MFDAYKLFSSRIGGDSFGKVNKVFKFTLIDNAKKEFIKENPSVKVIDMGVGEPEEAAPSEISKKLYDESLVKENRIYPNNGTPPFKEACARYLKRLLGLDFNPETEIMHCVGSKTGLAEAPFAFINSGDTVVATTPGYPVLPTIVRWLSADVVDLPLTFANKLLPDLNQLEDVARKHAPKILLLNYPNNPTGGVATRDFYEKVVALAHKYNFLIVQDAAYADFVYEGEYISPFNIPGGRDVTLELYSLSKSYNMQGYRLGFAVSNPLIMKAFSLVKDNIDNGQFIAIQKAGVEALDNCSEFLNKNVEKYRKRLVRVTSILNKAGIEAKQPDGSFYLYFKVPESFHGKNFKAAQEFTEYLIAHFGIITVPWEETGPHIRLSMTFEVGNKDFENEEAVYAALEERLIKRTLS
jgi:LL-diaminopimelate aminotransferase